jgi:hypothetical protein
MPASDKHPDQPFESFLDTAGALVGVDDKVAYFEKCELRAVLLGPELPTLVSWWEPVQSESRAELLTALGLLVADEPPSLGGLPFPESTALGWELKRSEDAYVVAPQRWHQVMRLARKRNRPPKPASERAATLATRALIALAPDTLASVDEIRAIVGLREGKVREARPWSRSDSNRKISAPAGRWLENLGLAANASSKDDRNEKQAAAPDKPQDRSTRPRTSRRSWGQSRRSPLGGPRSTKKKR